MEKVKKKISVNLPGLQLFQGFYWAQGDAIFFKEHFHPGQIEVSQVADEDVGFYPSPQPVPDRLYG